jgi:hypothetical protein
MLGQSNRYQAELERQKKAKKSQFLGSIGSVGGGIVGGIYGGPYGAAAGSAVGSAVGQKLGGGEPDGGQVIQAGAQGYQMGSAMEQRQNNQKFNTSLSDNIVSNPNLTPQQKQFADGIRGSSQDPNVSYKQAQSLNIDPKALEQQSINRNNNTAIINRGSSLLKEEQSKFPEGSAQFKATQQKIDRIESLRERDLGSLKSDVITGEIRKEIPFKDEVTEKQGKIVYQRTDPLTGVTGELKSFGDAKSSDSPSPTLRISAESAGDFIVDKVGGYPAISDEIQKDLNMLDRLAVLPQKNEAQAQKQIASIKSKYAPELKETTETVYLNDKKAKAVYNPNDNTFRFGKKVVPASEVSLEKGLSDDWRPQKVLLQKEEGGKFTPELVSYNPDAQIYRYDGKDVPSERVKQVPTGQSRKIYDSQGNIIMEETSGGGVTSPVKTELQKEVASNTVTLSSLDELSQTYDKKYLQLPEQFKVGGLKLVEKAGFDLSPGDQKRIEDLSSFQAATVDVAAKYIKTISGVAVSEPEAKRLRKVLPQAGDSPSEFRGKLNTAIKRLKKINLIHKLILNGDIPISGNIPDTGDKYINMKKLPVETVDKVGDRLKRENNWSDAQVGAYLAASGLI